MDVGAFDVDRRTTKTTGDVAVAGALGEAANIFLSTPTVVSQVVLVKERQVANSTGGRQRLVLSGSC